MDPAVCMNQNSITGACTCPSGKSAMAVAIYVESPCQFSGTKTTTTYTCE